MKRQNDYLIPKANKNIQDMIDRHIETNRNKMLVYLISFLFFLEFGSYGLSFLYLFPQSLPYKAPLESQNSQKNTLLVAYSVISCSGLIFGVFSGYVNDFVKRKYALLVFIVPYYILNIFEITIVIYQINIDQSYVISEKNFNLMRQSVLTVELLWNFIEVGYKVATYLIIFDYFLQYKFYLVFGLVILVDQDLVNNLQVTVYSVVVYSLNKSYYNKNNDDLTPLHLENTAKTVLMCIYIISMLISIYPFCKTLIILEEKHKIEEKDKELMEYNILGSLKQNIFENLFYLMRKHNNVIYIIIFMIFYYTSLFSLASTYQNYFFTAISNTLNIHNVFIPINNVCNSVFSIAFTIYFVYKFKDEVNPFGEKLDQKLKYTCILITVFNFLMLITNSCVNDLEQASLDTNFYIIIIIFMAIMFICSTFIGAASNILLICSTLKIVEIFTIRSQVIGFALSIFISALYGFEIIDYIHYTYELNDNLSPILCSCYLFLNLLSLFIIMIINSKNKQISISEEYYEKKQ